MVTHRKRLSLKQKEFAKKYVENKGNSTQAVLDSYNVSNKNMASVIGSRNLTIQPIQNEIERIMEEKNLTGDLMMDKLKEGMDANVVATFQGEAVESEIPDHDKRFKWWDAAAKIKGLYPATETINKNLNLDVQLENMSKKDFADLLKGLLVSEKKKNKQLINKTND